MTLVDFIDRRLAQPDSDSPFIQVGDHGLKWTEFANWMANMPGLYKLHGVGQFDHIGIIADHAADVAAVVLSAFRSGIGVVVINAEATTQEIGRICRDCKLSLLFYQNTITLDEAIPETCLAIRFSGWPGKTSGRGLLGRLRRNTPATPATLAEMSAEAPRADYPAEIQEDTTALLLNTSGTTAAPKVVMLSHANVAAQLDAFKTVYDIDEKSRILNPLPLHFTDGLLHGPIHCFVTGATLFRPQSFDISKLEAVLNSVYRDQITHLMVVPAILALMDRMGSDFADSFENGVFQFIRSSGDRLPAKLCQSIQDRFGVRVVNTYGMSETVCEAFYCGPSDESYRIGTVGRAEGCEWRIVDDNGTLCDVATQGRLQLRGPIITKGYFQQPEMTSDSFVDGWFKTGDLAEHDGTGIVTISGRDKDLIIAGGANVHPQEVADVLMDHPDVAEAAVFGMPHAVWGEQIAAAIVMNSEAAFDQAGLRDFCRQHLATNKVPQVMKQRNSLPRNPAGKVLIETLRDDLMYLDSSAGSAVEGSISDQVLAHAARIFGEKPENLHPSKTPDDIAGWDSFAHLNLITALEEHFEIAFSAREVLRVDRLSDLIDVLVRKHG